MLALERPRVAGVAAALVAGALALFALLLLASGKNPVATLGDLLASTLGSRYGLSEVFVKLIPILLTALATTLPARMGMVNVGGEGQLHVGALFAAGAALLLGPATPAWVGLPVSVAAGMLGGAAWAFTPALLRARGWLNETISTLLLNYVAIDLVGWFVYGALRDPASANVPQTPVFGPGFVWRALGGRVHVGLLLALAALLVTAFVLSRTRWGYEIRAIGGNPVAAHRHGLPLGVATVVVLCLGGALAGLAGTGEIMAIQGRLRMGFSADYGYLGFLVSWLAGHRPLRILVMGFVVAVIATGGDSLQIDQGLPSATVSILLALILMAVLAREARRDE